MGPLIFLIGKVFGKAMRINSVQHQQKMGVATSFLNDILGSSAIFKTFKLEQRLLKRYQQHSEEISALEQTKGKIEGATNATSQVAGNLTFLMAIVIAGYYVSQGDLEIGAMLAFIQLMNYLVSPFSALPGLIASLQQSLGGAERIFELMDQKTEYEDLPEDLNQKQHFEQLQLDAVSLSYSEEDPKPVLQDIHLQVKSGEMLAIVGPSGGGKSTLFKGLLGFYPFTQGSMRINDVDVEEMTLSKLRDYFAFVPQETHLYTGTIRDNLLSGDHLADDAAIHTALRRANAYEFVMELPQGLDTDIGEHGSRLSGGQRQRLSIARAILKDSPILLLDEATAALDNESEKIVQDALRRLMSEKTTLVIAHRLSTIQKADTIVVMDNGRIVERGTHEELLAGKGRYHALYYSQVERDEVTA
jgi:subfamily B ATP-binding cassette protein MsbA